MSRRVISDHPLRRGMSGSGRVWASRHMNTEGPGGDGGGCWTGAVGLSKQSGCTARGRIEMECGKRDQRRGVDWPAFKSPMRRAPPDRRVRRLSCACAPVPACSTRRLLSSHSPTIPRPPSPAPPTPSLHARRDSAARPLPTDLPCLQNRDGTRARSAPTTRSSSSARGERYPVPSAAGASPSVSRLGGVACPLAH